MQELDRALADITDIRSQVTANKMFKGFGPTIIAMTSVLAWAITVMQLIWPARFATTPMHIFGIWIFVACISVLVIGIEMLARSRRHHGGLADSMNMNAIEAFLPMGVAGAIIGVVFLINAQESIWALPGIWQILVALSVFSALKILPRLVVFVAIWYFLAGTGTLVIGSISHSTSPLLMGLPFIIGQFLMASILYKAKEAPDAKE